MGVQLHQLPTSSTPSCEIIEEPIEADATAEELEDQSPMDRWFGVPPVRRQQQSSQESPQRQLQPSQQQPQGSFAVMQVPPSMCMPADWCSYQQMMYPQTMYQMPTQMFPQTFPAAGAQQCYPVLGDGFTNIEYPPAAGVMNTQGVLGMMGSAAQPFPPWVMMVPGPPPVSVAEPATTQQPPSVAREDSHGSVSDTTVRSPEPSALDIGTRTGESAGSGPAPGTADHTIHQEGEIANKSISTSASRRRRRQRLAGERQQVPERRSPPPQGASRSIARDGRVRGSGPTLPVSDLSKKCSHLLEQLQIRDESYHSALQEVRYDAKRLALDVDGCRVVQLALEGDKEHAVSIAEEFRNSVWRLIESPHGNYVVQKAISLLAPSDVSFVMDELLGGAVETSKHRYGCRIMCRLIEHSTAHPTTDMLISEVLAQASNLCRHNFGHHVIEAILEHGTEHQRHTVTEALLADLPQNATNRNATYILEAALLHASPEDQRSLADGLLGLPGGGIVTLLESQFGLHVVKTLLRLGDRTIADSAREALVHNAKRLEATRGGRRFLDELELRGSSTTAAAAA